LSFLASPRIAWFPFSSPNLLILGDFAMKEFTLKQAEDIYKLGEPHVK
jgi:hypothetical protein